MTAYAQCILDNLKELRVGQKRAEEILNYYDNRLKEHLIDGVDQRAAELRAADEAIASYVTETQGRKQRALVNAVKQFEVDETMAAAAAAGEDLGEAAIAHIGRATPGFEHVVAYEAAMEVTRRTLGRTFHALAEKYGRKGFGIMQRKAGLKNILREIFDEPTGDSSSAAMASAWKETTQLAADEFRRAGGSLVDRVDWRIPQHAGQHQVTMMGAAKFRELFDSVADWNKMLAPDGKRIPPERRAEVMDYVFETIKTDGHAHARGTPYAKAAIGNKLDQHRFLVIKDADSWLKWHEAVGDGTIFDVMGQHIDTMAHNIAMIKAFGPNPSMMQQYIMDSAVHHASKVDAASKEPGKRLRYLEVENKLETFKNMAATINRETRMPTASRFGPAAQATRNVLVAAQLGGAIIPAVWGDTSTSLMRAKFSGLPASKFIFEYLRQWNPASGAHRRSLNQLLGNLESQMSAGVAAQRFTALETNGPAWSRWISDTALRFNGLTQHTKYMRNGFEKEAIQAFSNASDMALKDTDFYATWARYGLTEADWDKFRAIPKDTSKFDIITPQSVYDVDPELHDKFMRMIVEEGQYAVPDATIRAQVLWRGRTVPGTVPGELLNSISMYKNFPVTILNTHGRYALREGMNRGKWGYMAAFFLTTSMSGLLAFQTSELLKGRTPAPMDDWRTYGAGILKGGGLGIFGDMLFSQVNEFGGGYFTRLLGPPAQLADDITNLTIGNVKNILEGKDTRFAAEANRFMKLYTPYSKTPMLRLLLEREVFDQIEQYVDPKAHAKWKRQATEAGKIGQEFWWPRGQSLRD